MGSNAELVTIGTPRIAFFDTYDVSSEARDRAYPFYPEIVLRISDTRPVWNAFPFRKPMGNPVAASFTNGTTDRIDHVMGDRQTIASNSSAVTSAFLR